MVPYLQYKKQRRHRPVNAAAFLCAPARMNENKYPSRVILSVIYRLKGIKHYGRKGNIGMRLIVNQLHEAIL